MNTVDELPSYIHCPDCDNKHYLSLNRDIEGKWSIGYVEYEGGTVIGALGLNSSSTIEEAAVRMKYALKRYRSGLNS